MARKVKPDSSLRFPLWIIAVSLLLIALSLLLDIAEKRLLPNSAEVSPSPSATAQHRQATRRPNLPVETRPSRLHSLVSESASEEVAPVPLAAEAPVATQPPPRNPSPAPAAETPGGFAPTPPANGKGEIIGKVILRGSPPPETTLDLGQSRACTNSESGPLKTRFFVSAPDGGLADAVVFIKEGLRQTEFPPPANEFTIQFTNCQIEPYISAVMRGQRIRFLDGDGLAHAVRALSDLNRGISFVFSPGANARGIRFARPELFIPLKCAEHSWESAFVSVFDHPFFALTGSDGHFKIPNVPPGRYVLEAVHQKATGTNGILRSVLVYPGKTTKANFAIDAPK